MADLESRLHDLLESAAGAEPGTEGLAQGARRYAARVRRLRVGVLAALTAVVVAAASAVAVSVGRDRALVPAVPTPTSTSTLLAFQYCQQEYPSGYPAADLGTVSRTFDAALVCARTDADSVWSGSLPPDDAVVDPARLDTLRLEARGDVSGCPDLPRGPAFRLLLRALDGTVVSYPNESLRCDGWLLLADYFVALAEQRTDPATGVGSDGYLGCPPIPDGPDVIARTHALPPGGQFVTATVCLHPAVLLPLTEQPRFRGIRSAVLGTTQLVPLNRDLAAGSHHGPAKECLGTGWVYDVRGLTADGVVVDLVNGCPNELGVPGRRTAIDISPDTESMLRAVVVAN